MFMAGTSHAILAVAKAESIVRFSTSDGGAPAKNDSPRKANEVVRS